MWKCSIDVNAIYLVFLCSLSLSFYKNHMIFVNIPADAMFFIFYETFHVCLFCCHAKFFRIYVMTIFGKACVTRSLSIEFCFQSFYVWVKTAGGFKNVSIIFFLPFYMCLVMSHAERNFKYFFFGFHKESYWFFERALDVLFIILLKSAFKLNFPKLHEDYRIFTMFYRFYGMFWEETKSLEFYVRSTERFEIIRNLFEVNQRGLV